MTHEELIKIREDKNLTKSEFAALIGITPMLQGRYESGKINIPENVAEKVIALTVKKAAKKKVEKAVENNVKDIAKKAVKKAAKDTGKKVVKGAAAVAAVEGVKKERKATKKKAPVLYIQSLLGGVITTEEILKRIPDDVDEVYVKPEENKAYWVKGEEKGELELW